MTMLRQEHSGAVLGVQGQFHNVIAWPESVNHRGAGRIANQKFTAARRIDYDGVPAVINVEIRHDDGCRNGHESFAITGEILPAVSRRKDDFITAGAIHDDIAKFFPEFAPLIKWHLSSTDGLMHYVANAVYLAGNRDHNGLQAGEFRQIRDGKTGKLCWKLAATLNGEEISNYDACRMTHDGYQPPASVPILKWVPWGRIGEGKERELDAARRAAVWPDATDEELSADRETLTASLNARLPALLAAFRSTIESAGFIWSAETVKPDGVSE